MRKRTLYTTNCSLFAGCERSRAHTHAANDRINVNGCEQYDVYLRINHFKKFYTCFRCLARSSDVPLLLLCVFVCAISNLNGTVNYGLLSQSQLCQAVLNSATATATVAVHSDDSIFQTT